MELAEEIAAYMGMPLTKVQLKRFADGECYVQIMETIRGCDVFIIQPTWRVTRAVPFSEQISSTCALRLRCTPP